MSLLPAAIRGLSLDFANTLYPLRPKELDVTIQRLHAYLQERLNHRIDYSSMREVYLEIRARQFTQNRPTLRENDFTERIAHVVSSAMDGAPAPPDIVAGAQDAYASGFIDTMIAPDGLCETVEALSRRFDGRVVVCSNFIRADAIREPLARDGITRHLRGVVVSCEIGFIKPHRLMFEAAARILDLKPQEIVHVGDDWDADIIGASRTGMSTIYTRQWRDEIDEAYGHETKPVAEVASLAQVITL